MTERPLSREMGCEHCAHEVHHFFGCDWCLCPPHDPPGIYLTEAL